jgi:RNA polymerase sigma-70 factor (ECF subfamily)
MAIDPSAVVALNRAVAVAQVHGPTAAIAAVNAIANRTELESYYLFYAVLGELESSRGNSGVAREMFSQALKLTDLKTEQIFITKRLQTCP